MSIETWKVEFYPVPASEVAAEDALQHSLRKWIGLREENLSKHACETNFRSVSSGQGERLRIDGKSCALCLLSYKEMEPGCEECPIVKLTGMSCDSDKQSPWWAWTNGEGPEAMIAVLQECIAEQEKEKA